ncbi:pancreatic alpha-amylase-like isoform X2 [Hemicordylus capensis]|nr:pancreatic alpha-amylase-like isoform X2 [Hemicordylus capensis]XP_053101976.1 pancreatic alpha-amylase-like isoform X2 [Hemicordylus capensis]XP_053101977.1 pancreatic alpha-amylase-like isoform X2 [Hemicordylus capensis]XP_053101978.1 pancreatic alpha-amylase-like isoform X2 [Hemicordylus capensis]XP_053101979.1 pancreatic alpha-amylase-like isoform X2 [Hemicordylus capensis]XP_053101980.1 pancreatic alpha-amylase-like isoform X2 [Hemicordylus capensis]
MKSLLLLLLAVFGLCWTQYKSNPKPVKTSIVHLFEWHWTDVALECERYLASNGFEGVQVSPPNENLVVLNPWRPWWERYQPISYKLCSRSGNENEFRDMVTRCNNVGVHIYVDAVVNHMCGSGAGSGYHGTCGSYFNAASRDFPAVPYSSFDFNDRICKTLSGDIENYSDPIQVRNCRLGGLVDLAQSRDDVRSKIAEYMNHLVEIGVAGFRIDASKHIWPKDINVILSKVNNLNTRWFTEGSRPFIYQEVIDLGGEPIQSPEYYGNGRVTEFKYGAQLGTVLRKWNGEKMANLKSWGENGSLMPSDKAIVFVDNHDNQRGHGAGGTSILTFWNRRLYKMAVGFMLAHPYGFTRIMSSYWWPRNIQHGKDLNDWVGPPSNSDGSIKTVTINSDGSCGNGWVCEHRWHQIRNMVAFRNVAYGQPITRWWDNNNNQVAFGREGKGFVVFNNDDRNLSVILQTGLPAGIYCDIISGRKEGNVCTGIQIHIAANGTAHFQINHQAEDPFLAIHIEARL